MNILLSFKGAPINWKPAGMKVIDVRGAYLKENQVSIILHFFYGKCSFRIDTF